MTPSQILSSTHRPRPRTRLRFAGVVALPLAMLGATQAQGSDPSAGASSPVRDDLSVSGERSPQAVVGGTVAETCMWPSTVSVDGCSATLIHPQIIIYAGHCPGTGSIGFGERRSAPFGRADVEYCKANPNFALAVGGSDFAFCKLSGRVNGVPIVPVLMGCETEQLKKDSPITVVGFGRDTAGGPSASGSVDRKKILEAQVAGFPSNGKLVGVRAEDGQGICFGDSGGSAYLKLSDGTWRVFGITSSVVGGACPATSQHTPMHAQAIAFIEKESGIDVTPCHDADGTWNPSAACVDAPADPGATGRTWSNGCADGATPKPRSTCGPAFGQPPDTLAPSITITAPNDGDRLPGPSAKVMPTLTVEAGDPWGVRDVEFLVGDKVVATLTGPAFTPPPATFPVGTWTLTARGRDWSGNVGTSKPVTIVVGDPGPGGSDTAGTNPAPDTTSNGTGGSGTDGDGSGTSGSAGPVDTDTSKGMSEGSSSTAAEPGRTTGKTTADDTDGTAPSDGDTGCGCSPAPSSWLGPLVLPLATVVRRRRT